MTFDAGPRAVAVAVACSKPTTVSGKLGAFDHRVRSGVGWRTDLLGLCERADRGARFICRGDSMAALPTIRNRGRATDGVAAALLLGIDDCAITLLTLTKSHDTRPVCSFPL